MKLPKLVAVWTAGRIFLSCVALLLASCHVFGQSDLEPQNITVFNSVTAGQPLTVSWQIRNKGSAAADAASTTVARLTQSPDSPSGTNLASADTTALAAGATINQSVTLTAPLVPGTYYVWIITDINKSIQNQSDTGNDSQRSHGVTVIPLTYPTPKITAVGTPVIGSNQPQKLTIFGSGFVQGAIVRLQNLSTGEIFATPPISALSSTQIELSHVFTTTPATWSVQVSTPNHSSFSLFSFPVLSPSTRKETPALLRNGMSFYELTTSVLHIPAIDVDGKRLWVDLRYDGKAHAEVLASGTAPTDAALAAWFDPKTGIAKIPFVAIGTGSDIEAARYTLTLSLDSTQTGISFRVNVAEQRHLELVTITTKEGENSGIIATDQKGVQLALFGEDITEEHGTLNSATYIGEDGAEVTVFLNEAGLPGSLVQNETVVFFSNYTNNSVDVVIRDTSNQTIHINDVPIDPSWLAGRSIANKQQYALTFDPPHENTRRMDASLSDVAEKMRGVAKAMRLGGDMVGLASCAAATATVIATGGITAIALAPCILLAAEKGFQHYFESEVADELIGANMSFLQCATTLIGNLAGPLECMEALADASGFLLDRTADSLDTMSNGSLRNAVAVQQEAIQVLEQRGGSTPVVPTLVTEIVSSPAPVNEAPRVSTPFDSGANPGVSQGVGACSPIICSHTGALYMAWDYSLPFGADVVAVADGTVVAWRDSVIDGGPCALEPKCWDDIAQRSMGGGRIGNVITIKHTANGREFYATYMHLRRGSIPAVLKAVGARVIGGVTVIANVGNTGARDGTHLHYQVSSIESGTIIYGAEDGVRIANAVLNDSNQNLVAFLANAQQPTAGSSKSDLVPRDLSMPTTVKPGESITVSWRIHNAGTAPASAASTTLAAISRSATDASMLVGNPVVRNVGALAGRASVSQSGNLTAPTTPGTYYLWVKADSDKAVANQSDYGNDAEKFVFAVADDQAALVAPTITGVSSPIKGSSSPQAFTIYGTNFQTGATVTLRDHRTGEAFLNRNISAFSSEQITINPRFTAAAATWSVEVINPGNATSGRFNFEVLAANTPTEQNPSISSLSFTSATADSKDRTLTINGSNFASGNVVRYRWNNPSGSSTKSASVSSASQLSVSFNPGNVNDTIYVKVCKSSTSNDCSGELSIAVTAPVVVTSTPSISSLSFTSATADSKDRTLTINGSNFASGNVVRYRWNNPSGSSTKSASVSSASQLSVSFNPGNVNDTVYVKVCMSSTSNDCSGELSIAVTVPVVVTSTPSISSLSFTSATADSKDRTLTINGSNFASGNVVRYRWNNPSGSSTKSASVSSASQLSVSFNPGNVNDTVYVKVCMSSTSNDCSGELSIAVTVPVVVTSTPSISSLSFTSATADSKDRTLTINGSNFASGNVVRYRWNNPSGSSTKSASVSSASQLSVSFNPGNVNDTIYVKVCKSSTSNDCSGELSIAVTVPVVVTSTPSISSLSFTSATADSKDRTLTINGSNFASGNVVRYRWNNPSGSSTKSASVSSASQLSVSFNPGNVNDTIYVKVCKSSTSNDCSGELSIAVTAPVVVTSTPSISSLSFTSATADSKDRTLTINGSNFASGNVVRYRWNNPSGSSTKSASVSSASQLSVSFNPGNVNDTIYVKVCKSSTSNDCSGELSIAVTAPVVVTSTPSISSLSFTSATADSKDRTLTINGSNFASGNVVRYRWNNPSGSSTKSASVSSASQLSVSFNPGNVNDTIYVKVCKSSTSNDCSGELSISVRR